MQASKWKCKRYFLGHPHPQLTRPTGTLLGATKSGDSERIFSYTCNSYRAMPTSSGYTPNHEIPERVSQEIDRTDCVPGGLGSRMHDLQLGGLSRPEILRTLKKVAIESRWDCSTWEKQSNSVPARPYWRSIEWANRVGFHSVRNYRFKSFKDINTVKYG